IGPVLWHHVTDRGIERRDIFREGLRPTANAYPRQRELDCHLTKANIRAVQVKNRFLARHWSLKLQNAIVSPIEIAGCRVGYGQRVGGKETGAERCPMRQVGGGLNQIGLAGVDAGENELEAV